VKAQAPLASLLSQAMVALTIELDNEYEHGSGSGTWLGSVAMYATFLRFVSDDGIVMRDLSARAGQADPVHVLFYGMRRWGYVTYTPDIAGSPTKRDAETLVRVTSYGRAARDHWAATFDALEERWAKRGLDNLHRALIPVVTSIDRPLPEYFPIHGHDLRFPPLVAPVSRTPDHLGLLGLVAQALMNITIDYDAAAMVPLCVAQNMLRPFGDNAVLVRDLPAVTGVAKKQWDSGVPLGERLGLWIVEAAKGRGRQIRLTDAGAAMRDSYPTSLGEIEANWSARCTAPLARLRTELETLVGDGSAKAPVFNGLEPYPDGWRAKVAPITSLPHHPVVSHRGGYPDGS
jgi:hypothetical protein